MQEVFDQLDGANVLLKRALKKYLEASSAVQKFYDQASPCGIPLELSDRVAKEFSSLGSFERKLKRVKAAIGQARNHYRPTITIHSLPPEILSRVFCYVVGLRPCGVKERSGDIITFPKYPDLLTHVCSRWRRIVLDQPDLWSHLDIVPFHNMSPGFHARAKAAAAHAKLLDVHCYEPSFAYDHDENPTYRLFKRIGPQIRSLELVVSAISECFSVVDILAQCLKYSVAGVFDQLTIVNPGSDVPIFLLPTDSGDVDDLPGSQLGLMISPDDLEETLLPLTILRLDGVYFPWNYSAYHNLVELRLLSSCDPGSTGGITNSQLMNALTHSPRLQVLHFDLPILGELPDGASVLPVRLEQLRTLSLAPRDPSDIGSVLRLLAPGQNALKLSMRLEGGHLPVYDEHMMKFFERSNVEILRIVVMPGSTPLIRDACSECERSCETNYSARKKGFELCIQVVTCETNYCTNGDTCENRMSTGERTTTYLSTKERVRAEDPQRFSHLDISQKHRGDPRATPDPEPDVRIGKAPSSYMRRLLVTAADSQVPVGDSVAQHPSHPTHHASFVDESIRPLRQLRILILQELYMFRRDDPEPVMGSAIQRLDAIYLTQCTVEVSLLQQMVLKYPPKTLTTWRAYFGDRGEYLSTQELEAAFSSETCRFIGIGNDRPNPIQYWD